MLNTRGGIECDLTVARLAEDHFYIVTGTGFRTHDFAWIVDHIKPGLDAILTDVTENYGTLSIMGPSSRSVIQAVTTADMSNAAFKFGEAREIEIAGHVVRALRVTYVGELGWELHMPIAATGDVFDALMSAGKVYGIAPVGYRALESLRLEKGYRAWSSDITPNDTPLHAGLGWAVKMKSNQPFLGREAIEKISQSPLTKMLAGFTTEREDIVLSGRETILRNGEFAGYLTSGGYGYTVGKPIGFGYVRNANGVDEDYIRSGKYELVVAKEIVKANIHLQAIYDNLNQRVKS
jgi:4-methylaminobutanoate oxidase (formaldehyde-forming)